MQIVNGYVCFNCTDVGYAQKHIDPAHPKGDQATAPEGSQKPGSSPSVTFGGALTGANAASNPSATNPSRNQPGSALDLTA